MYGRRLFFSAAYAVAFCVAMPNAFAQQKTTSVYQNPILFSDYFESCCKRLPIDWRFEFRATATSKPYRPMEKSPCAIPSGANNSSSALWTDRSPSGSPQCCARKPPSCVGLPLFSPREYHQMTTTRGHCRDRSRIHHPSPTTANLSEKFGRLPAKDSPLAQTPPLAKSSVPPR